MPLSFPAERRPCELPAHTHRRACIQRRPAAVCVGGLPAGCLAWRRGGAISRMPCQWTLQFDCGSTTMHGAPRRKGKSRGEEWQGEGSYGMTSGVSDRILPRVKGKQTERPRLARDRGDRSLAFLCGTRFESSRHSRASTRRKSIRIMAVRAALPCRAIRATAAAPSTGGVKLFGLRSHFVAENGTSSRALPASPLKTEKSVPFFCFALISFLIVFAEPFAFPASSPPA